jgi:TusA-related sulfurtransferase/ferredoxin
MKSREITADVKLDVSGLQCPILGFTAAKVLADIDPGQILEVKSNTTILEGAMSALAQKTGDELLGCFNEDGIYLSYLKKESDSVTLDCKKELDSVVPGSGCPTTSCGVDSNLDKNTNSRPADMKVIIDGKVITVNANDKNIVEVVTREKIAIPATCYRAKKKKGCCHGCVVEVDGEQKFACDTAPEDGMNIVIDREDLKAVRKNNLIKYNEGIESGNPCECSMPETSGCSNSIN